MTVGRQLNFRREEVERQGGAEAKLSGVIPAIELKGTPAERLKLVDAAIARLRELRRVLTEGEAEAPANEMYGPYIHAPVWPWTVAGWTLAVIFMLLFLVTWLRS